MDFALANCDHAGVLQSLARLHLHSLKKENEMHKGTHVIFGKKEGRRVFCRIRRRKRRRRRRRKKEIIIIQHPLSVSESSKC